MIIDITIIQFVKGTPFFACSNINYIQCIVLQNVMVGPLTIVAFICIVARIYKYGVM